MKIEVGKKYRRVAISHGENANLFLNQIVEVTEIDGNIIHFIKKLKNGNWRDGCNQNRERFLINFKPLVTALENR